MKTIRVILVAVVLSWMTADTCQAFYNPQTGRWLSRDPIEESGGQNIYAFPLGDPVNQVDYLGQDGSLDYRTKTRQAGKCGGFTWVIHWKVKNSNAKISSSIVQRMAWTFSPSPCGDLFGLLGTVGITAGFATLPNGILAPYWEAWGVHAGASDAYSGGGDDSWHMPDFPFGDDTRGSVTIQGDATYYPNVPFPPDNFYTNPGPAGTGFWTPTDPNLTGGTGTVTRSLTATWNCCCGSKDRSTKLSTK